MTDQTDTTVITLTVPSAWLEGFDKDDLRTALHLGLAQIRQQRLAQVCSATTIVKQG